MAADKNTRVFLRHALRRYTLRVPTSLGEAAPCSGGLAQQPEPHGTLCPFLHDRLEHTPACPLAQAFTASYSSPELCHRETLGTATLLS